MGETFLSYSREQYYFAKSLALHLQQRGLAIWFDIQQLEPGVHWAADIQDGLTRSTALILVASHTAMRSPYVAQEWRHALDNGKPIVVALYERCSLPADLRRRAVVVDFRSSFERGVERLAGYLQAPQPPSHPANTLLRLPRLTAGVRRMTLTLGLDDLRLLLGGLLFFWIILRLLAEDSIARRAVESLFGSQVDFAAFSPLILAALGGWLIFRRVTGYREHFKAALFLRHDLAYDAATTALHLKADWGTLPQVAFYLLGLHFIAGIILHYEMPSLLAVLATPWVIAALLALLLLTLMVYLVRAITPPSPLADIVRWCRIGQVSQAWRIQVNQALVQQTDQALPSEAQVQQMTDFGPLPAAETEPTANTPPLSYRVIYAPGDKGPAQAVENALNRISYARPAGDGPAICTFLLLSYRTPLAMVQDCVRTQPGVIAVLVTDIRMPKDLPELGALQLVDYRRRDGDELRAALSYLTRSDPQSRASLSLRLLPVNLGRSAGGQDLRELFNTLMSLSFIGLLYAAWVLGQIRLLALPVPDAFLPPAAVLLLADLALWVFGFEVLRGVALFPARLLTFIATLPGLLIAWVELSAAPVAQTLPDGLVGLLLDRRYAIVFLIAYLLSFWYLIDMLFNGHLLVRPGAAVLGMQRLRPPRHILLAILIVLGLIVVLVRLPFN